MVHTLFTFTPHHSHSTFRSHQLLDEWFRQEEASPTEVAALLKPFTDKLTDIQFVRSNLRAWEEQFRLLEGLDSFRLAHGRLVSPGVRGGSRAASDGARALQSRVSSMEAGSHEQGDAADLIEDHKLGSSRHSSS